MSVPFESAARLNALKVKIDAALGTSSSTLSKAVDNAIERGNIQTEEQTVTPTAAGFDVTPASGKYLSKVTVNPVQASALEVTPTESDQTFTPDADNFFSSVLVKAAEGGKKVYTGEINVASRHYAICIDTGCDVSPDAYFFIIREEGMSNYNNVVAYVYEPDEPIDPRLIYAHSGGSVGRMTTYSLHTLFSDGKVMIDLEGVTTPQEIQIEFEAGRYAWFLIQ